MPPTGALAVLGIWYRFVALPGAYVAVLAPGGALTRYARHQYWLQQQAVPLAWTFGPFSSSVCLQN